ncbi:MAG TPA: ribose-phosphate pyrophosphokinase [Candidatus Krumholzibacteria bacterium]|nr:ribose-phosphate pyrophosphokinase [Candidatus Krumholzibacteria bacterium]
MGRRLRVLSGRGHEDLAVRICKYLDVSLTDVDIHAFSDGELRVKIQENIRGADVFIIQPTQPPAENLLELLLLLDAARRSSAQRITAVVPYFGYARQDRKDQPRVPISAKLMANLITTSGADRMLTMDLHAAQIQGFFDIPMDHLYAAPVLLEHFMHARDLDRLAVVAPDVGSVKMARAFAKQLGATLSIIDKRRPRPNQAEVVNFIGDVRDRDVVIFDDMIDTAGTMCDAAKELVANQGAKRVDVCATHPLLSGPALDRLNEAPVGEVVVTNTIHFDRHDECAKIEVLDISQLLAEAIKRIHLEQSISSLFL